MIVLDMQTDLSDPRGTGAFAVARIVKLIANGKTVRWQKDGWADELTVFSMFTEHLPEEAMQNLQAETGLSAAEIEEALKPPTDDCEFDEYYEFWHENDNECLKVEFRDGKAHFSPVDQDYELATIAREFKDRLRPFGPEAKQRFIAMVMED